MLHVSLYKKFLSRSYQSNFLGCGHCKNLKPELIQASIDLHEQQVGEKKNNFSIIFMFLYNRVMQ